MTLTKAQREHLEFLDGRRPAHKQTRAGYNCRVAGLSEWLWKLTDGSEATNSEVERMPKPLPAERCLDRVISEVLTEAGRRALSEASHDR